MSGIASAVAAGAAVVSAGAGVASAAGKYKGGQSTSQADLYQAQAARNLAKGYEEAGTRAVQGGEVQADVAGLQTREAVGRAKAQQGANSIDVSGPTATAVREGIGQAGRLNQLTALSNAQLQNWGYRLKAQQETDQANLYTMGAGSAATGGAIGAAGSLLGSASSLPFSWLAKQFGGPAGAALTGGGAAGGGGTFGGFDGTEVV